MAYSKKTWNNDEVITQEAMNNIESGVASNDTKNTQQDTKISEIEGKLVKAVAGSKDGLMSKEDKTKLDGIAEQANKYVLPAASTSIGGVKQATKVDNVSAADATNAVATNPTQAEFNKVVALANETKAKLNAALAALKTAGVMANS